MGSRRKFLANSIGASLSGLTVILAAGCEQKVDTPRDKAIRHLQESASPLVKYVHGEGYVYDVSVGDDKVHVNLSQVKFTYHRNKLKYSIGDTDVRVYAGGEIEVWSKDARVNDPEMIAGYQQKTDQVLEAVADENRRLFKLMLKSTGRPIDTNHLVR